MKLRDYLNEIMNLNVWTVTTNKREILVMASTKSHAEAQGEAKLKKGETIKTVMRPRK